MKHTQDVYKSDLQAVKIWLEHFLDMFHAWEHRIKLLKFYNGSQCVFVIFPLSEIGVRFGINADLGINPNSIP